MLASDDLLHHGSPHDALTQNLWTLGRGALVWSSGSERW